jgi:hypothetical protein
MKRVGINPLKQAIEEHVKAKGNALVERLNIAEQATFPIQYAETLSALHKGFRSLIDNAFNGEVLFVTALDAGCRAVVNRPVRRGGNDGAGTLTSPDVLAKYCDLCLKKSKHVVTDAEIEEKMSALIVIFQCVLFIYYLFSY